MQDGLSKRVFKVDLWENFLHAYKIVDKKPVTFQKEGFNP